MTYRFQQIEPQPARGKLTESMWTSDEWVAEEKYDGDRRIAQFCGNLIRFTGRHQSVQTGLYVEKTANVPHLSGHKIAVDKPNCPVPRALEGTVLDGEIVINPENMPATFVDEGRSKYVTSIMGSLPDEAVRKQIERGWLNYVVFDCLFYKGVDLRNKELRERGSFAAKAVKEWGNSYVHLAMSKGGIFKKEFRDEILDRGGEGVVLKHLAAPYGAINLWVKWKKTKTADVVIMGFIPPEKISVKKGDDFPSPTRLARLGLIGAIQCGQYKDKKLIEVATVSGMSDDVRRDLSRTPKDFLGCVITIAHNGREPTGRFRHPRFKAFRQDKAAYKCVLDLNEV